MKRKGQFTVCLMMLVSMALAACVGTGPDSCCPSAIAVTAQDPWVCPGNCPNGGKTRINYQIDFKTRLNGETCNPDGTLVISVKNLTDNKDLTPLKFTSPPSLPKTGTYDISLTKDTEYEITAKLGDTWCGTATGKQKVNVVDPNDFHTICASGPLDPPKCSFSQTYVPFGTGVLIQYVKNNSSSGVNATMGTVVNKDGKTVTLQPYASTSTYSGYQASGQWTLGLDSPSCKTYTGLSASDQTVCVDVYLMCSCK